MYKYHLITVFLGTIGFFLGSCMQQYGLPLTERDIASININEKAGKQIASKYGMSVIGKGGGADKEGINLKILSFNTIAALNLEQARKLIIDCIEEFLTIINTDEEIRPYLKNFPFTIKNVKITIFFETSDGLSIYDPLISVTYNVGDTLHYATFENEESVRYKTEITETYEEGLAKLKRN